MIIQHNMLAMNNLLVGKALQNSKAKNMERLASGYRINRAADDAANMAISEKMTSRIRALARCKTNIEEGISLTQTADGALNEVNNMLNRVNELCVQAANDTNTADDRSKIANEITQIYDEMERVFKTTEFNTMKIFRHDGDNYYGPEPEYLYHEKVTKLDGDQLSNWGASMFPTKYFDTSREASPANATLTLPAGVSANDKSSVLNGTAFYIDYKGTTYTILFGAGNNSSPSNTLYINTSSSSYDTILEAMNRIVSYHSFIDKADVSGNKVTFTFDMPTENKTISFKADTNQDGIRETITATETLENGATNNGISIYCAETVLDPIGTPDSAIRYKETATVSITPLSAMENDETTPPAGYADWSSFLSALSFNELRLFGSSNTEYISLAPLAQKSIQTAGDFRRELATLIDAKDGYSATFDGTDKNITITKEGLLAESPSFGYIDEIAGRTGQDLTLSTTPVSVSTQSSIPSSEAKTTQTFTMPELKSDQIYTFKINNSYYLLYDGTKYPNYSVSDSDSSRYYSVYNTNSYGGMEKTLLSILRSSYSGYNVSSENGTVTMVSKELNDKTEIRIDGGDPGVLAVLTPKSSELLSIASPYYNRDYSVSLDFTSFTDSGFDPATLYGKGFMLNNTYYQFTDGNTSPNSKTKPVNIASVSDLAGLGEALQKATGLTASGDNVSKVTLSSTTQTNTSGNSYINFADGSPRPTFTNSAVSSGGTAYKNPQAEINFSSYDMDNLDELYGTGFRITCATCPGEFINVMFCHDKSELSYPKSFNYTDENGRTNLIHNYMVELKDVTSGSQITANIVDQLKNDLDHFTEVKVSDTNPSVLIAQDKRSQNQSGRAQILAGVYTNFVYHVDAEKIPDPGELVGGGRKDTEAYYTYCMIYAGDTKEKPYVPVHLPYLSVSNLKLEYPGEPWDSYEKITDVMNRSKNAAEVISMARSKIGADQNRLEHAFDYAANAEEQISDAVSRIKDTDMADAVTEQAKLTILSNAQEAMLSQIVSLPEQILPLLQQ